MSTTKLMFTRLGENDLAIDELSELMARGDQLQLSSAAHDRIQACRHYLEQQLADQSRMIYGINTGFGALCNIRISDKEITQLQSHLVTSHACGMGDTVPAEIVQMMLLLKIQNLSLGHSGVRPLLIERLIGMYNQGLFPVIYQLGSLGASGDLAPLAHLSLPLIGEGEFWYQGQITPTRSLMEKHKWQAIELSSKEGLALLNGTQFTAAYGLWCLLEAERLWEMSNLVAALSLDAFHCQAAPFEEALHRIRPHAGQLISAQRIRQYLSDSELIRDEKSDVQDPYAFRCIPQVHGASYDAIHHVRRVLETEVNSVTDNPTIFPEEDQILSGGNFHAQPLALCLDYLALAVAELGSISERRTYKLLSGTRGLKAFLAHNPGLHSGMMITQYTAAAIVSQNKQLCTPASVDSIVSSNGQEDHVSMGANAATKLYRIVQNLERILAIEWMAAAQALEARRPAKTGSVLEKQLNVYRNAVPSLKEDRPLYQDLDTTIRFLQTLGKQWPLR